MFVKYPCGCVGIRLDAEHVIEVVCCGDTSVAFFAMKSEANYRNADKRTQVPMEIVNELVAKIGNKIVDGDRWEEIAAILKQAVR